VRGAGGSDRAQRAVRDAVAFHRQGNLAAAEDLYQSALATEPDQLQALQYFGLLRMQQNRPADAWALLERALAVDPRSADALSTASGALMALGRLAGALEKLNALITVRPGDAAAHYNRGVVLAALERADEAVASYSKTVELAPNHGPALFNLANVQAGLGRYAEALACYERVLALAPQHLDALNNSANALNKLGRYDEALLRLNRLVSLNPNDARALTNRGLVLKELRRHDAAIADLRRALTIDPGYATAHYNLGNTLLDLGRPHEAVESFTRAVELAPDHVDAYTSRADAYFHLRRPTEAVADFRKALAIRPDDPAIRTRLIFVLNFDADATTADQQAERALWARCYEPLYAAVSSHANAADPERRLRIGYVSPYFCGQAATYSFGGVIAEHDSERFDVVCYSDTQRADDVTERLRSRASTWRDTLGMSDEALADLVRADGIDILVDLVGHMRGHRLALFARKPAPVQVTAWGEPTGSGLKTIDYLLADPVLVPEQERALLSEKVLDLPNFLGFWTPGLLPEPGPLPAMSRGYVTFGSFNRFAKMLDPVLRAWAHILRAVPNSRLLLKKDRQLDDAAQTAPMLALLAEDGIAPDRITMLDHMSREDHFASYRDMDIALDPFPHGGGMTTLDALWMGVPVVTWPGRIISSRLAAASLTALGLTDFIAPDVEAYTALAVAKAKDLEALAALRSDLRPRLAKSTVGDPVKYARTVEAAYREMWRRWCASR
jgi:protein O-GlcNAc transferase